MIRLAILLSIICFSCSPKSTPSVIEDIKPIISDSTYTYLALGDSYTIGESVSEAERFPNQLADSLRVSGTKIGTVRFVARTGWTTDDLQNGILTAGLTEKDTFSMVTLLIGVNNQYRGRSVEDYKPQFEALLDRAIQFAGGKKERVIVVSIPDYAYTPFGGGRSFISEGIDWYNNANETITRAKGVAYANITPISRQGLSDPSLVAADKLHPSGKQYTRWISVIKPLVRLK